ncbi:MAG TPA: hypothetical protein VGJ60_07705 [Chloroflexota bacterium]|jgi:hypothetical protein
MTSILGTPLTQLGAVVPASPMQLSVGPGPGPGPTAGQPVSTYRRLGPTTTVSQIPVR